ncbi:MAG: cation diffusion facilitator family transporter [Cyanobacteria bacterium RYN_339]|nr:cation diffusion facilitator family transporter [Cyanobacteria bacterium RYN_339]
MDGTRKAVLVAFIGNVAITLAKFVGAYFSGSVAIFAEGLHSVVDTLNQVFLWLGLHLQERPASDKHPFGYGKERFFWSFVAAIFIFASGALVSFYEGVDKFLHPEPLRALNWALGVLAFAFAAEYYSFRVSYTELKKRATEAGKDVMSYLRTTRDPTLAAVFVEESAALVGIVIALVGVSLTALTGNGRFDAAASVAIGLLLTFLAVLLGERSRSLLLGQGALPEELEAIHRIFAASDFVEQVIDCYTMQLGPEELLLAAHLQIRHDLSTQEIEARMDALEQDLAQAVPSLKRVFLEAENAEEVERKIEEGKTF